MLPPLPLAGLTPKGSGGWVSQICVMGLDAIEITMPVEEAFDIRSEDTEVASIATAP